MSTTVCISTQVWKGAKDGMEVKSMIDLVVVRKDVLQDVKAVRRIG